MRGVRQLGEFNEQQLPHVYYTSVRGHFLQLFQLCQDAALQPDILSELQNHCLSTILKGKHREGNNQNLNPKPFWEYIKAAASRPPISNLLRFFQVC